MNRLKKVVLSLSLFLLMGVFLVGCKNKDAIVLKDAKEALNIEYIEGEDVVLPSKEGKVDISWESSHPKVISDKGKVVAGENDILVTLTASLTYKKEKDDKEFKFNVKARVKTDAEKVSLAHEALSLPNEKDDESDLNLVNKGLFNTQITWTSSHEGIINPADGSVLLPEENTTVILTATIKLGVALEIKTFEISVKARPKTDAEKVLLAKNALILPSEKGDEIALSLVNEGMFSAQITWASSNDEIINRADGSVLLPEENTTVTLTATIRVGSALETKTFEILVKERPKTDAEKVLRAKNALVLPVEIAEEIVLDLVTAAVFNAQITWASSNDEIINPADGTVLLPEEETIVTLTATIKIGTALETKTFEILVKARPKTNAEKLVIVKNSLLLPNEIADESTLLLVNEGEFNAQITWASSNEEIIDPANGIVLLPEEETTVTLTATIKIGTSLETKTFEILVKERPKTDIEKALRVKNSLLLPNEKADEEEFIFINEGEFNAQITWSSSHEEIIDVADGTVVLPEEQTIVTLTATIKVGTAEEIKEFEILVKAYDVEEKIFAALDRIIVVPEFTSGYQEEDFNAVQTTNIKGYNVDVSWTSSNEKVMLANGSLVKFYYADEETVTLSASITFKGETKKATTEVMKVKGTKLTISEVKDLETSIQVKFTGIVTGVDYDRVIVDDNTAAIYVNLDKVNQNVLVGDKIIVLGKTQVIYSRLQIRNASITIESSGNEIPPGLISLGGLSNDDQGMHITISNLTVILGSKNIIKVTDGINEIMVYGSSKNSDVIEKMAPIRLGTIIDLNRAHVGVNSANDISLYVFDISVITINLTNEEIVARSAQTLELPEVKGDLEPIDVPRYGKYGGQIIWTSSDNDVINQESGEVTFPDYDITITMTAKVFLGPIEETKTFYVLVKRTLVGIRTLHHSTDVEFTGIVTGIDGNTVVVNDYYGAMFVDVTTKPAGLAIGDEVNVIGKTYFAANTHKIKPATMEILSTLNSLPEILTSLEEATHVNDGQRFKIDNVQVSYYHGLGQYNVTDGTNEIALWYAGNDQAIKDYLSSIKENTLIDIKNSHLQYNTPVIKYLLIYNIDDIVIKLTDLEKATLDLEKLILSETIDEDITLVLPEIGFYESVISWESSDEEIINPTTGKVLVPLITKVVTLTASIEVNEEVLIKTFEIECIGKPRTFEAKYTGTTNIVMVSPGNNADKLGLNPEIFTVSSNRLQVAPRKYLGVALVSTGKIVLGEVNGEGHILGISVGSDYNITNIKISYGVPSSLIMIKLGDHPSTTGPTIAGATVTYNDLNINEFVIRNVGTGALEITSILITVAVK